MKPREVKVEDGNKAQKRLRRKRFRQRRRKRMKTRGWF